MLPGHCYSLAVRGGNKHKQMLIGLQSQRRFPLGMGGLIEDWTSWSQYIGSSPTRWKKLISRAVQHSLETGLVGASVGRMA